MQFSRMITAVDAHACGEPGRVITGGVPDVPGKSMFEKMTWLATHNDGLRKLMLREPRGYPAANGNLILPPTRPAAQACPGAGPRCPARPANSPPRHGSG